MMDMQREQQLFAWVSELPMDEVPEVLKLIAAKVALHVSKPGMEMTLTPEEIDLVRSNHKLSAIKLVRDRLGLDLKTALAYVERAMHGLGV